MSDTTSRLRELSDWIAENRLNPQLPHPVVDATELEDRLNAILALEAEQRASESEPCSCLSHLDALRQAIEAMDMKMTRYGSGEWVEQYVSPAGPWHAILGLARNGTATICQCVEPQPPEAAQVAAAKAVLIEHYRMNVNVMPNLFLPDDFQREAERIVAQLEAKDAE